MVLPVKSVSTLRIDKLLPEKSVSVMQIDMLLPERSVGALQIDIVHADFSDRFFSVEAEERQSRFVRSAFAFKRSCRSGSIMAVFSTLEDAVNTAVC